MKGKIKTFWNSAFQFATFYHMIEFKCIGVVDMFFPFKKLL